MGIRLKKAPIFGRSSRIARGLLSISSYHTFASITIEDAAVAGARSDAAQIQDIAKCSIGAYRQANGKVELRSPDTMELSYAMHYPTFRGGVKALTDRVRMSSSQVRLFISMVQILNGGKSYGFWDVDIRGVEKSKNLDEAVFSIMCPFIAGPVDLRYNTNWHTMRQNPSKQTETACIRSLSKSANCQTYGNMFFYNPDAMASVLNESSLDAQGFDFNLQSQSSTASPTSPTSPTWQVPSMVQCVAPGTGLLVTESRVSTIQE